MMDHILNEPLWLIGWVSILMVLNTASIFFLKRIEARFVLLAWLINFPLITYLYETFGYVRLLGLSHIVVWTPLLIYLWLRRRHWWPADQLATRWIAALFAANFVSLLIDYTDLARWLLGERGPL